MKKNSVSIRNRRTKKDREFEIERMKFERDNMEFVR